MKAQEGCPCPCPAPNDPAKDIPHPFPIHAVDSKYFVYDVEIVTHLRISHQMCGVLIGTLPQAPQQNLFLGLPLELMTEEAALLLEQGHAFVVDDCVAHQTATARIQEADRVAFLAERAAETQKQHEEWLENERLKRETYTKKKPGKEKSTAEPKQIMEDTTEDSMNLFNSAAQDSTPKTPTETALEPRVIIVPAQSTTLTHDLPTSSTAAPPQPDPARYALYKHLHARGYYSSPGLRFGAHYLAYPGDPLRYHSHFVANGLEWGEPVPLVDVVGGGRLGTGVKKAWLIGGENPETQEGRCFSVEWAGFG
ncbi:SEN34 subunit of tRNA-splicing endonuclease [Saitoella complicata NRRL Y-17804]|nr:SEN34 subunit of tRNA-splicing endonuclease [Saitoella complicata NRRL Y-17804]ODQ53160.1 SEN34 subunit of tRNA-splicing endonuclease [Saitoella complicata NRRL Y-17804]